MFGNELALSDVLPISSTTTDTAPFDRAIKIPKTNSNRTRDFDCTYHAGIGFAYFVPNRTIDLTVGTLMVEEIRVST